MAVHLEILSDFIREKIVNDKWTHHQLSSYLQQIFPGRKGYSIRSIQRFCSDHNIHKTSRLNSSELDSVVLGAICKVIATAKIQQCEHKICLNY